MQRVLLVDGDSRFRKEMKDRLTRRGVSVACAGTAREGLRLYRRGRPAWVFAEAELPDGGGFPVLEEAHRYTPVVMVSEGFSPDKVYSAISGGAFDCLSKPVDDSTLDGLLYRLRRERNPPPLEAGPLEPVPDVGGEMVVGRSQKMVEALKTVAAVAGTSATVLIGGESGTGKELMAREIHRASRRSGAFVALNCVAVMETLTESELFGHERGAFTGAAGRRAGCFEQASHGTLFLDEIGDALPGFQAKLLRVLDQVEFRRVGGQESIRPDVRVVAATNADLEQLVAKGMFRADLYYRLSEVTVLLPPLRDRLADIPLLARRTLSEVRRRTGRSLGGISQEAMHRLMVHPWPGNVRELQNVLVRAALLCRGRTIQCNHLKGLISDESPDSEEPLTLSDVERRHIEQVLNATGWNRGMACEILGVSRPTLRRKIRDYGLLGG